MNEYIESCHREKRTYDEEGVREAVRLFLKSIGEDPEREGLVETPDRIARACRELFAGLQASPADVLEKHFDVDTDELNEELEDLNCAREDYPGGISGIGPEEIDLIIDLCNGKDIPTDKRLSLLRAIHHIKDTQIERSILESINGSDSRISKFLDEAEHLNEATPDSD